MQSIQERSFQDTKLGPLDEGCLKSSFFCTVGVVSITNGRFAAFLTVKAA